jgi:hypothetical protein
LIARSSVVVLFHIHYQKQGRRREQKSLARVFPWVLGEELFTESKKNSRRRILHREQAGWLSAKKFFAESFFIALGEEILKKSLFHLQFFSIINMHLYKGYVQI